MKKFMLLVMVALFVNSDTRACEIGDYVDQYDCVAHRGFGTGWRDPNGLIWSEVIGSYSNIDLDGVEPANQEVQKSAATEACRTLGGELPTFEDYRDLIYQLPHTCPENGRCRLKPDGIDAFSKMFPGTRNQFLWSNATYTEPVFEPEMGGWAFNSTPSFYRTNLYSRESRHYEYLAQCVSQGPKLKEWEDVRLSCFRLDDPSSEAEIYIGWEHVVTSGDITAVKKDDFEWSLRSAGMSGYKAFAWPGKVAHRMVLPISVRALVNMRMGQIFEMDLWSAYQGERREIEQTVPLRCTKVEI
jgi:hypothetical protein